MLPATTDVLVIGAGPAGLALAATLAQRGVDVTVVDRQPEGANTSRAAVVHARTLEVLEEIGVSERLTAVGIHAPLFTIRDRDRVLIPVRFDQLPTRYPYALMVSQAVTEATLVERLTELGGQVLRPYRLIGLDRDGDGAVATFASGELVRARFVVGADGAHSTVRELAGIGFSGSDIEESFTLADIRVDGGLPRDEVVLFFSTAGMVVSAPLPDGSFRIVAGVPDAPEHPTVEFIQSLLEARGPRRARVTVREVVWGSRFRIHHRVADTFRSGPILLVGDAAHVHSPAGGQGMNLGLQDAVALGSALPSDKLLDEYAAARRPVADEVVGFARTLTRLATVPPVLRPARNLVLRLLAQLPAFRRRLAWRLSGLVYRA